MKSSARHSASSPPARIHLRIKHPKLDPNEITKTLAISPEHTLEAGRSASSSGVERLHAECYWIAPLAFPSYDDPWLMTGLMGAAKEGTSRETSIGQISALQMMAHEAVIALALRKLQSQHDFFQRIREEGGSATLLITTDQPGSMTIQPSLARKLADAGLSLELDWSGSVE
jgi:hypothetical protein